MQSFILYPTLDMRTNVPLTDPSLLQWVGEGAARAHCVDARNIDFTRIRNSCSKSQGRAQWSNTAVGTPSYCLGIFELYDGTNRVVWIVYDGDVYRYDATRDPNEIQDAGSTAFASDEYDLYSFIRFGNYMVFADRGEHTPYCADHNDATLSKLISSGTEYKFRYLESFARRIIGAYSDQTNGDIEIRWSNDTPTPASSCTFSASDQLYIPNDDPIVGIKKMGQNACYVYCEDSVNRLDYYANYSTPFGLTTIIDGQGATNHHSIVNENGVNFLYNKNLGFCVFDGSYQLIPISISIENWLRDINSSYTRQIVGARYPYRNSVVWTVPLEGSDTPNALLFYDYSEKKWTRRDFTGHYITDFINATDVTWTKLTTELGYTTWASLGSLRWADLFSETPNLGISATDGHLYSLATEEDVGSDYDGYRIEPALELGGPNRYSLLNEIWFQVVQGGEFNLYVYYRNGDTESEIRNNSWIAADEISFDTPSDAICRLENITSGAKRLHQIRWGTDQKSEQFSVNRIEFKYTPEKTY